MRFVSIKEAAELLRQSQRHVRRLCKMGKLPGAIFTEADSWRIPVSADVRLNEANHYVNAGELSRVPQNKIDQALGRLGLIREFEKFAAGHLQSGGSRTEAIAIFTSAKAASKRSLERWMARYRVEGLLGLVDTRGGGQMFKDMISPEAFEQFKAMYLTQQRLSVKTCWLNICFINKDQDKNWDIPSLRTMQRHIKEQIPLAVRVLHREGLGAYEAKCAPYVLTDPDSVKAGQIWVGDHHQLNCWIRYRGKWLRPWITVWEDMRSRAIVGRYVSFSPNQTTILLASKRAIEKYGPPDSVKIDNGRDYDSELWTGTTKTKRRLIKKGYIDEQMVAGLYAMLDIAVSFAIPYHPQSKPVERWFDTLDRQLIKTIATYCGKDTDRKPDYLNDLLNSQKAIDKAYDLESFTQLVDQYIDVYNNAAHTGNGMNGKSPLEVMSFRLSRRVMADGVLGLLMRVWSGELKVGKNGVNFKNFWYGQFDMELMAYQGKKVRVAYDPDDLRCVHVYNAATMKLITIAEQAQLIQYGAAVSEEALRAAMKQKAKAVKVVKSYKDTRLTAETDLASLTIKAMAEGKKETPPDREDIALRPVVTPLNGQVFAHNRLELKKLVKKAAGAESTTEVLGINLAALSSRTTKGQRLKLFDD